MLHIIFAMASVETLAGVATCGKGGGKAGSSYELDAARSIKSKIFSLHILDLPAASYGRHRSLPSSNFYKL
jgi:hypothetical protein